MPISSASDHVISRGMLFLYVKFRCLRALAALSSVSGFQAGNVDPAFAGRLVIFLPDIKGLLSLFLRWRRNQKCPASFGARVLREAPARKWVHLFGLDDFKPVLNSVWGEIANCIRSPPGL